LQRTSIHSFIKRVVAYFFFFVALSPASTIAQDIEAEGHYRRALSYEATHDTDGAIVECRKALEGDPHHVKAHVKLGQLLLEKRDIDGALEQATLAAQVDPDNFDGHVLRSRALYDLATQAKELRIALGLPHSSAAAADAHYRLALVQFRLHDLESARVEYKEAFRLDPQVRESDSLGVALGLRRPVSAGSMAGLVNMMQAMTARMQPKSASPSSAAGIHGIGLEQSAVLQFPAAEYKDFAVAANSNSLNPATAAPNVEEIGEPHLKIMSDAHGYSEASLLLHSMQLNVPFGWGSKGGFGTMQRIDFFPAPSPKDIQKAYLEGTSIDLGIKVLDSIALGVTDFKDVMAQVEAMEKASGKCTIISDEQHHVFMVRIDKITHSEASNVQIYVQDPSPSSTVWVAIDVRAPRKEFQKYLGLLGLVYRDIKIDWTALGDGSPVTNVVHTRGISPM
jgi:tetratricopeptide (TPR) repeat protein